MRTFSDFLAVSKRKLSAEQLAAVESDVATVVSAGAGSGKTTVLSYRFLRLIMEEKAKVDEILTLTFTKKAASEMYEILQDIDKLTSYHVYTSLDKWVSDAREYSENSVIKAYYEKNARN